MSFLENFIGRNFADAKNEENTRIILVLSKRLLLSENKASDNRTDISSIQSCITEMLKRIKKLEGDVEHLDHYTVGLNHSIESIEQYTKILSGRIAKLKGKENEKTDNPTG